jgi:glycogen phosphorylase
MTYLALNLSHYTNGVAKKHGEVSRRILTPKHGFNHYKIDAITNGVHAATWVSPSFQQLFDQYIPSWRQDNFTLRYACGIPGDLLWNAHMVEKKALIATINRDRDSGLQEDVLTLGFARRATAYKRPNLIFTDIERLERIVRENGPLQLIFAGKAHPRDSDGKELIRRICQAADRLKSDIRVIYLENYDMASAKLLVAGCDVWLNTPQPPMEASGTSGMKAALNGVPSLSVLDGWWIEGCIEGKTGWAINGSTAHEDNDDDDADVRDANSLYGKLATKVMPLFYKDRIRFTDMMIHAIALNGSFFNTQRMMQQYVVQAYR